MNAGLIVIILLLVLSILGIPIYLALGRYAVYRAPAEAFCRHELQLTAGNPVLYAGREYYVSQYYREAD